MDIFSPTSSSSYVTARSHTSSLPSANLATVQQMTQATPTTTSSPAPQYLPSRVATSSGPGFYNAPPPSDTDAEAHLQWMLQALLGQWSIIETLDGRADRCLSSAARLASIHDRVSADIVRRNPEAEERMEEREIDASGAEVGDAFGNLVPGWGVPVQVPNAMIGSNSEIDDVGYDAVSQSPAKRDGPRLDRQTIHAEDIPSGSSDESKPDVRKMSLEGMPARIDSIIGRRCIRRDGLKRVFEYLARWQGRSTQESGWQLEEDIQDCSTHVNVFLRQCEIEEVDTRYRVALLSEAKTCWDEKGVRRGGILLPLKA